MLCRWLDDNFLVVLPSSVEQLPFDVAKQLQQVINGQVMPSTLALTCSIGFTTWQKEATVEQLFHQAEDALMQAKHEGKSSIKGA
jgi:diguanylate cyclase (GGDEF)-like protein